MNNDWLKDVIEFQKRMMELSKNFNASGSMQDLVRDYMANWGINELNREKRVDAEKRCAPAENPPPPTFQEESSHEAILSIFLPGIVNKEDLTLTIIDELLHVTGISKVVGEENGSFSNLFHLPVKADAAEINAFYESDYLIIRIPKLKNKFWKVIDVQFK